MRVQVVNPNASVAVTARIEAAARAAARPGTEIVVTRNEAGPEAIQSAAAMRAAGPGFLAAIARGEAEGAHAHVAACFGDPGIAEARRRAAGPVLAMAEAAMHAASPLAEGFVIVTTLARMRPFCEAEARACGMAERCRGVAVIETDIRDLAARGEARLDALARECAVALETHRAGALVLGSAGFCGLGPGLSTRLGAPVLDGVALAVAGAQTLVGLGLRPGFGPPAPRTGGPSA